MHNSLPVPTTRPARRHRKRKLVALTTLSLAGLLAGLLSGCGTGNSPGINASATASARDYTAATGNWKFTTGTGTRLSSLSGFLTVSGTTVTGTLHPLAATCAASTASFPVSGTIDANSLLSITSTSFPGGKVAISGTLAADSRSLTTPSVTVTDGTCATSAALPSTTVAHTMASPTAQQYQSLTGTYNGSFTDSSGATLPLAATLSQPTTPDADGVYHLTGYATFANNSCLNTPVITDSTVTGDSIQATYTDKQTNATIVGTGTFSADATSLTITNWVLSGCGDDTGTGFLTRAN